MMMCKGARVMWLKVTVTVNYLKAHLVQASGVEYHENVEEKGAQTGGIHTHKLQVAKTWFWRCRRWWTGKKIWYMWDYKYFCLSCWVCRNWECKLQHWNEPVSYKTFANLISFTCIYTKTYKHACGRAHTHGLVPALWSWSISQLRH